MKDNINIKKILTHLTHRSQTVSVREAMNPEREWATGVILTVLLVLLGGLVSYYLYQRTINLEVTDVTFVSDPVTYNGAVVEEAVTKFRNRAVAYEAIRLGEANVGLPTPVITEVPAAVTPTEILESSETIETVDTPDVTPELEENSKPELSF
jgi:hypothetical protein